MEEKSRSNIAPHQELHEFLTLLFNSELNKPKEYSYDFEPTALYLSLKCRSYNSSEEKDRYVTQMDRLYQSVTMHLGYHLKGLHVWINSTKNRSDFLHTFNLKDGLQHALSFEYSENLGISNYFQCELPIERGHILEERNPLEIDTFNELFIPGVKKLVLYVPMSSVRGMIFSKS